MDSTFHFRTILEDEVRAALKKLNPHKATGVDGISAHLLQIVASDVAPSITKLFNDSLTCGQIPTEWKKANVTPIPKTTTSHSISNFRPISVLPIIAKVFESLIHHQLYTYLTSNSLLTSCQSGFHPAHCTQDVLLKTVDDWKISLDNGKHVRTILIDLTKAFDSIDHTLLLRKLSSLGIQRKELNWFSEYLSGRSQRVCIESTYSEWANITKGVPQGSILGPLLFLIFVNDLPDVVTKCSINLYADDTTIYYSDRDPVKVQSVLNTDLDLIANWIKINGLPINVAKTQFMILSRRAMKPENSSIKIELQGTEITKTDTIKYLGLLIDSNLSWKSHTDYVRRKSLAAIACIRRFSRYLPVLTRKILFSSLVLPHLDYCSVVWHSCNSSISQKVEQVQNYGMRVILGKPPLTRSSPLRQQLNWTTLHQRCHSNMLCQVHRCTLKLAPNYLSSKFMFNSSMYTNTRGAINLHINQPKSEFYRSSFEYQGAFHYNRLPLNVRLKPNIPSFRSCLRLMMPS